MSYAQLLSAAGLIRTSRRRGFCPACRLFQSGDTPQEIAAPAVVALAVLVLAALAWGLTVARMRAMDDMTMGLGAFGSFVVTWTVMMAAMMIPTATPLVFEFARTAEGRRGWRTATVVLAATYLAVWVAFGVACYALYNLVGMPWPHQGLIAGGVLVLAGLYAATPVKRASEARCRELCALHGPLPFNLMRSAVVAGGRYGLSCLGCTAGLMLAMVLIGMSSLGWMVVLATAVLIYKLAPAPSPRWIAALSVALVALGILYAVNA